MNELMTEVFIEQPRLHAPSLLKRDPWQESPLPPGQLAHIDQSTIQSVTRDLLSVAPVLLHDLHMLHSGHAGQAIVLKDF